MLRMALPVDIQLEILNRSCLPIDTYLYFRREFGLNPKKLTEVHKPHDVIRKLNELCDNQCKCLRLKKRLEVVDDNGPSWWLVHITKDIGKNRQCEIMINEDKTDNKEVQMYFTMNHKDVQKRELYPLRKTVVNMHTGKVVYKMIENEFEGVE